MSTRTRIKLGVACVSTLVLLTGLVAAQSSVPLTPMEELGKKLFFDRISNPPSQSCATCHNGDVGWTGPVPGINLEGGVYRGANPQRFGNRKPPSSAYSTFSPVLHIDASGNFVGGMLWDGRATGEVLGNPAADQALGPFLVPVEQNNPSKEAVCLTVKKSKYAGLFEMVWGPGSLDCSSAGVDATYARFALSLAAYEASPEVSPFSSKFDAYLMACMEAGNTMEACGLAEGDQGVLDTAGIFTAQEFDGLIEFGEYCAPCHISHEPGPDGLPPLLTNFEFDNIGVPRNPDNPFYDMDKVYLDDGSPINPDGEAFVDLGLGGFLQTRTEWVAYAAENLGKQKVPTLRNVDRRFGPKFPKAYMHNGFFKNLADVVRFYNTRDVPAAGWPPPEVPENVNREILEGVPLGNLELDAEAEAAIVAFLKTLSDGFMAPRRP